MATLNLDDWERGLALFKANKLKSSQFVFMGRPSTDLRGDLLSKKRIGVSVGKLHKIMSEHPEVNYGLLDGLKEGVNSPKYVLQSATEEDSIVVIPIILEDGRVFVVPIRKNFVTSTGETINMITSIYLKEDPNWLSRERDNKRIIFERE